MLVEVEMRANDWLVENFPERCVNRNPDTKQKGSSNINEYKNISITPTRLPTV